VFLSDLVVVSWANLCSIEPKTGKLQEWNGKGAEE